jgi:hypothetical protein
LDTKDAELAELMQERERESYRLRVEMPERDPGVGKIPEARGFSPMTPGSKSLKVNWSEVDPVFPGDDFLNSTFPNKEQRKAFGRGDARKEFHSLNVEKRDWNIFTPLDRQQLRKNWSPSKTSLLEMAKYNLEHDVPAMTSTPMHESRTEEHRRNIAANVEEVDILSETIKKLQLEETDDEAVQDDMIMMDLTTTLGRTMPSILEGTYEERLSIVMDLSRKTEEVVTRKSRRLAHLQPEKLLEMENKREKRRLEWKIKLDKIERQYQRKPKSDDEDDNQKETDHGRNDEY